MELFELRKQPHLSVSSVNDYAECGLLYKLGRIDKLPFEAKSDALEFGSVIHLVLAEFYEERMVGNKVLLKDLHESFEDRWRKVAEGNTNIEYANGKDFETLLMGGKDLLTTWYNKLPDDNFRVMAIEEAFSFYHRQRFHPNHRGHRSHRGRRVRNDHHHRLEDIRQSLFDERGR